jgi:hypothetical protein
MDGGGCTPGCHASTLEAPGGAAQLSTASLIER